jgi:hypothetical protein
LRVGAWKAPAISIGPGVTFLPNSQYLQYVCSTHNMQKKMVAIEPPPYHQLAM